jgi:hypothetical protein
MSTPSNHNGKKPKTAADLLAEAGQTMNPGGDWRAALATVLDVRPDSVRQLLSGRTSPISARSWGGSRWSFGHGSRNNHGRTGHEDRKDDQQ